MIHCVLHDYSLLWWLLGGIVVGIIGLTIFIKIDSHRNTRRLQAMRRVADSQRFWHESPDPLSIFKTKNKGGENN